MCKIFCVLVNHYVIYTERESVLYHGIKTPKNVLKKEAVGGVFKQIGGVLRPW